MKTPFRIMKKLHSESTYKSISESISESIVIGRKRKMKEKKIVIIIK